MSSDQKEAEDRRADEFRKAARTTDRALDRFIEAIGRSPAEDAAMLAGMGFAARAHELAGEIEAAAEIHQNRVVRMLVGRPKHLDNMAVRYEARDFYLRNKKFDSAQKMSESIIHWTEETFTGIDGVKIMALRWHVNTLLQLGQGQEAAKLSEKVELCERMMKDRLTP